MDTSFSRSGNLFSTILLKISLYLHSIVYMGYTFTLSSPHSLKVRSFHGVPELSYFLLKCVCVCLCALSLTSTEWYNFFILSSIPDSCIFYMICSIGEAFHWGFSLAYWGFHFQRDFSWVFFSSSSSVFILSFPTSLFHASPCFIHYSIFLSLNCLNTFMVILLNSLPESSSKSFALGARVMVLVNCERDMLSLFCVLFNLLCWDLEIFR